MKASIFSFYLIITIINFVSFVICDEDDYLLVLMDQSQGAKCLDGSPTSIYIKNPEKYKTDPNKFIFFFQSGGWCYGDTVDKTMEDCLERSKTNIGTSTVLPRQKSTYRGILDVTEEKNPYFYNYTTVFVNYCDGTGHQGYLQNHVSYDGETIWFRGKRNTLTALKYAKEVLGMAKAEEVIITGCSAGGLAVYTWLDYIANDLKNINSKINIYGYSDAGLFMNGLDYKTQKHEYENRMKNFFHISNFQSNPISEKCLKQFPSERWQCMFAVNLIPHIDTPLLISNSAYDGWAIINIVGTNCIGEDIQSGNLSKCDEQERKYIDMYRQQQMDFFEEWIPKKDNINVWYISCVAHGFETMSKFNSKSWNIPALSGNALMKAVHQFVQENERVLEIEQSPWPQNFPCAFNNPNKFEIE